MKRLHLAVIMSYIHLKHEIVARFDERGVEVIDKGTWSSEPITWNPCHDSKSQPLLAERLMADFDLALASVFWIARTVAGIRFYVWLNLF